MQGRGALSGAAAGREARLEDAVLAEQLRVLARRRADLYINLVMAIGVALTVWRFYPVWVPPLWLGLVIATVTFRLRLKRIYLRDPPHGAALRRWASHFIGASVVTGCLWGVTASVILVTPAPAYQLFTIFALGGMTVGGMVLNAGYPAAMWGFLGPAILPTIAVLLVKGDTLRITIGLMLALFVAAMVNAGRGIHQSLIEGVRLRLDQEGLVARLAASEASMAQAQSIAGIGSWSLDPSTEDWVWSKEMFRIFGLDASTTKPSLQSLLERIHPDDRSAAEDLCTGLLAAERQSVSDYRVMTDDGAVRWVHGVSESARDSHGNVVRRRASCRTSPSARRWKRNSTSPTSCSRPNWTPPRSPSCWSTTLSAPFPTIGRSPKCGGSRPKFCRTANRK